MNLCPDDQRPVEIQIDLEALLSGPEEMAWYNPQRPDMWRFGGLLPLDVNAVDDRPFIVSLGEGSLIDGSMSGSVSPLSASENCPPI